LSTLAIIGGGLMGRSLIYHLAKEKKHFEKIVLFSSDKITIPCTLNSTAMVALRGVTKGHSELGDLLVEGHEIFSHHVKMDHPQGVQVVKQFTGTHREREFFLSRYPEASLSDRFFHEKIYLSEERAFMIDPKTYIDWLLKESQNFYQDSLHLIEDMVVEAQEESEGVVIKTLNNKKMNFHKVIFAGGSYNRFWTPMAPHSKLKTSKPVQGSYLEFQNVSWEHSSFSLTVDEKNLIWNAPLKRLFIGSTSSETPHYLPQKKELREIYDELYLKLNLKLPSFDEGEIKVGLREKAQKRAPYMVEEGRSLFVGGLYKNAFTLSLKLSGTLSLKHL